MALPLTRICRACKRTSATVQWWASVDTCAACAEVSLSSGSDAAIATVRIPRPLLLKMLNAISGADGLLRGEVDPKAAPAILAEFAEISKLYKALAAEGAVPSVEQIAKEFDAAGIPRADGAPASGPRVWRPGDP